MNRIAAAFTLTLALVGVGSACSEVAPGEEPEAGAALRAGGLTPGDEHTVDIIATQSGNEHKFSLSDDEITTGWTTFRFANASTSDHFVLLYKAPQAAIDAAEGANQSLLAHWRETITVPFQEEFDPYSDGEIGYDEFLGNLIGEISGSAAWFLDPGAPAMGGPGLAAAGHTTETTVNLEPGTYVLECYVKDADEEFHSYNGMLEMLTVTDQASGAPEPTGTMGLSLSSTNGIHMQEEARAGKHTIAIEFGDQTAYEHLQGHNAHLVRLENADEDLLGELAAWMDWREEGALALRAPEGAEFLGGTMEMAGGGRAYYTVDLTPGEYAWIAEVPDPAGKNMLKTFSVPARSTGGP